jgi:hypothetical protein
VECKILSACIHFFFPAYYDTGNIVVSVIFLVPISVSQKCNIL